MFGKFQVGFEHPWMLLLLVLIPISWYLANRSLSGLGQTRKILALIFRSLVLLLITLALAGIQWIWISDRQTVIYLLDQSDSIPVAKRQLMLRFAIDSVKKHRREKRFDRAGLILFGREASIEIPPLDENLPPLSKPESNFGRPDATNLEGALKLAAASFLEDSAKRIVVLTDGVQTLGVAEQAAKRLAESGIGIDVVPVRLDNNAEIMVEKIDIPGSVRQGQTIDARVVINRFGSPENPSPEIPGRVRVVRKIGNQAEVLVDSPYVLDKDINVIPVPHKVDQTAGYTYEADFIPDSATDDTIGQNNRATAFTYARGKSRVLLIEDANNLGDYDALVDALRKNDIVVDVRPSSNLFSSLVELQIYDSIILAGVPRTGGDSAEKVFSISDQQIEMMVQSTRQTGLGIVMLGGPEAFGAGGWSNTKLEEAMPVNFTIKNTKVEAVGALAMVMHASEMPEGNHWQKVIGKAALESLGPADYCGVIKYDGSGDSWLWGGSDGFLKVGENGKLMRSRMSQMVPGDMPAFDSSLKLAIRSLKNVPASVKHMIVISDGDPTPASAAVLNDFVKNQIKISTVAVGAHGSVGTAELKRIANTTGGNYYVVTTAAALPKIFMREARRVARPVIFEPEGGVQPIRQLPNHEILSGIRSDLPTIRGFVLTERKESPLVEVPLLANKPAEQENASILATWNYGLGRTAVFTTDAGKRWAKDWVGSPNYDQFFSQLVRWSMRPSKDDDKFSIATQVKDGRVQVIVNATDKEDNFLNFLDMNASATGPDLVPITVPLRQQAPGRYVGEFAPDAAGSYMLSVVPGGGRQILTTGVNLPFSDEYRIRQANMRLIETLAQSKPLGGEAGKVLPELSDTEMDQLLGFDTYRPGLPPARSLKDIWPFAVLLGASLFFADVFVRRVAVDFGLPIRKLTAWLTRRKVSEADQARQKSLDQLRSRKTKVSSELDKQKSATSFELPEPEVIGGSDKVSSSEGFGTAETPRSDKPSGAPKPTDKTDQGDGDNYTARLLEAKRKAKKNNNN